MSDDLAIYLLAVLVGLFIWAWVLNAIIHSATRTKEMYKLSKAQALLLAEMAIKAGVDETAVREILTVALKK